MNEAPRNGIMAGAGTVLLGIGAFVAHNAGLFGHEAVLLGSKSAVEIRGSLDDLARGTYVESQSVSLFCAASASLNTTGELPEGATNWRAFVKDRVGITDDSEQYFDGKLAQLETAMDLAQHNPRSALRYAQACAFR